MDRRSLIGIVLIAVIIGAWVFYQGSVTQRDVTPEKTAAQLERLDSAKAAASVPDSARSAAPSAPSPAIAMADSNVRERILTIETDLLKVRLSSKGGTIKSWTLKKFRPWYAETDSSALVDLVQPYAQEYSFWFRSSTGARVEGKSIDFVWDSVSDTIRLTGSDTAIVRAIARTADGGSIERAFTFSGSKYDAKTSLTLDKMESVIPQTNRYIQLEWKDGIRYQEKSTVDESNNAVAIVSTNGDVHEMDVDGFNSKKEEAITGRIDYAATRSKYFVVALIPPKDYEGSVYTSGIKYGAPNDGNIEYFGLTYKLPYRGGRQTYDMTLYAGPMQYDTLSSYGLTGVMNFGFKWIVKPIGEYFMLPTLRIIHAGIPNYGIAIILFAILMKVLLYPLSIQQMKSAQKMQLVAPIVANMREKYKDDMKSQQQETMKIYSEYGINPAGGCLPLLLQMPFLYALYAVLNLNVELRQAAFLPFWITDLSVPDVILSLPFKIPLFNIDKFSGLALVMGATLFIQQKQTIQDPRQKAMVYLMPVMLTLMFSTLPSGLNLYYLVFNILGIGQQIYMTKFSRNRLTLDDLRKMPKKESWLQKKMAEAQSVADQRATGNGAQPRKTPPPTPKKGGGNGKQPRLGKRK
ncbi:MAG: membrane protein insertase YidC [bacterium]|nr:membrane protein insertase YidC [bacterium]